MEDLVKDFTVVVGHRKLRTNRGCLEKHSDYFKAMFSSGMRESRTSSVKLHNVDEDLMCQIIEFCERGVRPRVTDGNALRLLAAGMMLQMDALKSSAEQFLVERLSLTSFSETFKAADFYGSASLRDACARFVCWSLEAAVDKLTPDNLELVQHILRSEYSHWNEDLMFKAVMAVIRGRSVDEAQPLVDCIFARNVRTIGGGGGDGGGGGGVGGNDDDGVFSLYRSAGFGASGRRKESRTLAVVLDSQEAFLFDRRLSKFVSFTRLPLRLEGYGLVAHHQHCYLIGGEGRIGYGKWNNVVYRYSFMTDAWEYFADMPECRRSFATFVTAERIYVLGGYGKFRTSLKGELAVLHLESRRWTFGKLGGSAPSGSADSGDALPSLLYRDSYFYLFNGGVQKRSEDELGRSTGDLLAIDNFPVEPVRCALPHGHDIVVITVQNNVYFCNLATRTAKQLELLDARSASARASASASGCRPDFHHCHLVDGTLFNVKVHKITEYQIDVEASTLTKVKTYRMIDETSHEKIAASCKVPYF